MLFFEISLYYVFKIIKIVIRSMGLSFKIIIYSLLFFTTLLGKCQNLIPNPGFEKRLKDGTPTDWTQPKGEFYHYEFQRLDTNGTVVPNYLHGLCTIMPLPSEYLCVKLKKAVEIGKTYHLKIKTYIKNEPWNKPAKLKYFECAVLPYYEEVSPVRIRIKAEPLAKFEIDTNPETLRPFWQYHEKIFTAKTSGEYFYIGRFHNEFTYSLYDSLVNIEAKLIATYDSLLAYIKDTFAHRKLEMPELNTGKRALKKQKRMMYNFINTNRKEQQQIINNLKKELKAQFNAVNQIYLDSYYFHVRIYYDDLCLAEVRNDSSCDCKDTMYEYKPRFEVGKTYALRNINFELDKAILLKQSYIELNNLLQIMKEYPKMIIKIMGHTDNQNSDQYNIKLSNNRAKACVNYLIKKGIEANRLQWQGYGERIPIATNNTEEGKAANRRVEFKVLKVK